jgi:predicted dehydrogenase
VELNELNIGLIGAGLIGRTHSIAFKLAKGFFAEKTKDVSLKVLAEENEESARSGASNLGFDEWTADYRELLGRKDIQMVIIAVPNYKHKEIVLEAVESGKHVLCEKPLALNAQDAKEIYDTAQKAGIKHGIGFNYRKAPAIMLIKRWVEKGLFGDIVSYRSSFIQDWGLDVNGPLSWRFQKKLAGSGSLGDLGSHAIDMGRFLVGEISEVIGTSSTHIKKRPISAGGFGQKQAAAVAEYGKVDVDDVCDVLLEFENGAQGSIVASRLAPGRKNHFEFEVYGTKAGVFFDWERPSEVLFSSVDMPNDQSGFNRILVGGFQHPYGENLWPIPGMGIGFAEPFAVQLFEMIDGIINDRKVLPNFYDGWKVNQVLDAVESSVKKRAWCKV